MLSQPTHHAGIRTLCFISLCVALLAFVSLRASRQQARTAEPRAASYSLGPALIAQDKSTITPAAGNTITVNSTSDVINGTDGLCTLREAIKAANTNAASGAVAGECVAGSSSGSDTVDLTGVTGTINLLTTTGLVISSEMTVNGPGANFLTVRRNDDANPGQIPFSVGVNSPAVVTISGLTISNGFAHFSFGGGIDFGGSGTLNVTNCVLSGNSAYYEGGGIYSTSTGILNVTGSTLSSNESGIYNDNTATINLVNSTVSNNSKGGIVNQSTGSIRLVNSTVSNNGGGVANNSTVPAQIRNSIIALNATDMGGRDVSGLFNSQGHNLIGTADGSTGFTSGVNGDIVGTSAKPVGILLAPLANYGGPTPTRALLPGGRAFNAGDNCVTQATHCGDPNIPQLTTDQRGLARQVNGTVDIGAFESRGFTISATSGTQTAPINSPFGAPLVATVTSAFGEPVAGGAVPFNAPASGPGATFAGGVTQINATISANGQASALATANGLIGGPYNVIASSNGVTSSVSFSLTNVQPTSTTAVSSSVNPSASGQSVTFTATVTSSSGTPTGTVQFKIDGSPVGAPVSLNVSGVATLTTSSLTVGTHAVVADYSGNAQVTASTGTLPGGQRVNSLPALSIDDLSDLEGDPGGPFRRGVAFTVTLSSPSSLTVTVNYTTANGTANSPSDYDAASGTLTFAPGETTRTFVVPFNADQTFEPDETFTANLSNPVNATISKAQGTGTILNDDAQGGIITFNSSNYNVSEITGFVTITVNRTNDISGPASVDYATGDTGAPASCSAPSGGKASSRCDFTTAAGTLTFAAGESLKTFRVLISQDNYVEGPEVLTLTLSNLTGGAVFGVSSTSMVTITDSAPQAPPNPIDDAQNFVRQHYHDFLNREPDASGLAFWTNQIISCGSDQACIEIRRINVSAAFFLSIEFQQTGYLIERLYKTAYGSATGSSTFGINPQPHTLPVPIVRLSEFLPDTQSIGQGVVVGQPGWEGVLENNKQAFTLGFVQRPRFTSMYPTSMTPAQFVDALFANAGVAPSANDLTAAINEFGGAATTSNTAARARALRLVAENSTLMQQEFNRAFVLMQFFGYLRRNPNDSPDTNYTGYDFWLTKLNTFNGNFQNADMVKGFITSGEYRNRFGP